MSQLKNKVAIVTGAASGIGLACAQRYAAEGATVIGMDRNMSSDWSSVEALAPANRFHQVDVTDGAAQRAVVADTLANLEQLIFCSRLRVSAMVGPWGC